MLNGQGQGPNQRELIYYCQQPSIDIIVLSFVHLFPAQGNGYPGTNFGNRCGSAVFPGPGYDGRNESQKDALLRDCPTLARQIPLCQKRYNKKIILSLGGAVLSYQLTGARDGTAFGNLLWYLFGPRNTSWVSTGGPRPFDFKGVETQVDGFDLDIEGPATDGQEGYKALVARLRNLYDLGSSRRQYFLTASPQCIVPDANMGETIKSTKFDMLFLQFYNTPQCSAASWVAANSKYKIGGSFVDAGFTYTAWTNWLSNTPSAAARLYIGLPGAPAAASAGSYINTTQARSLASAYYCRPNLGGIAIWEATYAEGNVACGNTFYAMMKKNLLAASADSRLRTCPVFCYPSHSFSSSPSSASYSPQVPCRRKKSRSSRLTHPPETATAPATPGATQSSGSGTSAACGPGKGYCASGACCSQFGYCGTTAAHCGTGCQSNFGTCGAPSLSSDGGENIPVSSIWKCGTGKTTCVGNGNNQCCS
jgi:chitinase